MLAGWQCNVTIMQPEFTRRVFVDAVASNIFKAKQGLSMAVYSTAANTTQQQAPSRCDVPHLCSTDNTLAVVPVCPWKR
jgi:hypothetical protein